MRHFVFVLKCPYSLLAVSHNSQSQWVVLYSNFLFKANKLHNVVEIRIKSGFYDRNSEFKCLIYN